MRSKDISKEVSNMDLKRSSLLAVGKNSGTFFCEMLYKQDKTRFWKRCIILLICFVLSCNGGHRLPVPILHN